MATAKLASMFCPLFDKTDIGLEVGFKDLTRTLTANNVYCVDSRVTVSGDGSDWSTAFKTIAEAITANNASIDWGAATWLENNYIFIAPGVYAEALTAAPYSCWLVGMGSCHGTDCGVVIKPTAGSSPLAGTLLGTHIRNIRFEANNSVPCLDLAYAGASTIDDCYFFGGVTGTPTAGIDCDNMKHCRISNCYFLDLAYGIYARGGADKYFHETYVENCVMNGIDTAGIWIQDTCTATSSIIRKTFISYPTKGIDDNNGNLKVEGCTIFASSVGIEGVDDLNQFGNNIIIAGHVKSPFPALGAGPVLYVDNRVSASGNGRSWDTAYKTIQEAITASNALINWAASNWLVDTTIVIFPGSYAEALTPAYSAHIVGLGQPGTDQAVEIHPASGKPLSGTGLGLHLKNLWFESEDTSDVLDFGICNGVTIENCRIVCGITGTSVNGISTENCNTLVVKGCHFTHGATGGFTYGIYAAGGADKYFHNCDIVDNVITGVKSGGTGIYIAVNCTASASVFRKNTVSIAGAAKGVDVEATGATPNSNLQISDNTIVVGASGDAIYHAGGAGLVLNNHVNVAGVSAIEDTEAGYSA